MSVKQLFEVSSLSVLSGNDGIKDCVDSDRVQKSWWTKRLHQEQRKYLPMYRILSTYKSCISCTGTASWRIGDSDEMLVVMWSVPFYKNWWVCKSQNWAQYFITLLCIMFTVNYVTSNYHRVHPIRFIPSKISTELNHCFKVFQL